MEDLQKIKKFFSKPLEEASSTEKFLRKLGWAGEDWTPQEFASQIKKLSDSTLIAWAKSNKGIGKGIPNTPLAFQQKLVKIEMDKRGLSLDEANGFKSGKEFINIKLRRYPKAVAKINQLIDMIGESNFTMEMAEWIWDFFNNASFENPVNEAKEEDPVDTITMDIPLFLRMLEYSREDAKKDLDLHNVTEKANKLGKERGILSMEDYDAIVGAAEDIKEIEDDKFKNDPWKGGPKYKKEDLLAQEIFGIKYFGWLDSWEQSHLVNKYNLDKSIITKESKEGMGNEVGDKVYFRGDMGKKYPSSQGYYGVIKDTSSARNYNMMAIYQVVVYDKNDNEIRTIKTDWTNLTSKKVNEGELTEAYVPSNIKEFAKRKGISSLVNKVADWAEKVGARITGGIAIGKNYNTLILDMGYQTADISINIEDKTIELYGKPVNNFPQFKEEFMGKVTRDEIEKDENQFRREQGLEETLVKKVMERLRKL